MVAPLALRSRDGFPASFNPLALETLSVDFNEDVFRLTRMFSPRSFATRSRVHAGTLSMRSVTIPPRNSWASSYGGLKNLWATFRPKARRQSSRAHSCCPGERAFGNYELKVTESVTRLSPRSITGQPSRPASLRTSFERRRFSGCVGRPAHGSTLECGIWRRRLAGLSPFRFLRNRCSTLTPKP
jgi:hypothetical protein